MDASDSTKQREKLLYRRGTARLGLKSYDEAIKDLSDPVLAKNKPAAASLAKARELLKRANEKSGQFFAAAFKKAASAGGSAGDEKSPAQHVRFATPEATDSPVTPAPIRHARSAPGSGDSAAPADRSSLFAGRTPHPAPRAGGAAPADEGDDEEEDEEDGGDSGGLWPLLTVVGVAVLAAALGYGALRLLRRR